MLDVLPVASEQQEALLSHQARLTRAELEVLASLLTGLPAKTIAVQRGASVNTVRTQIMAILEKTGFRSQRELIASFGGTVASGFVESTFGHATTPSRLTRAS
ncbi:MAG TPA: helix-turn-helix transcriptional regulator, partial [Ramlibacter sp.]|nr:helix-turn-helix transcriptional regulator [Ramlibacter sp.]